MYVFIYFNVYESDELYSLKKVDFIKRRATHLI